MNTNMILSYLTDLSKNNNREWYHAHKKELKIQRSGIMYSILMNLSPILLCRVIP